MAEVLIKYSDAPGWRRPLLRAGDFRIIVGHEMAGHSCEFPAAPVWVVNHNFGRTPCSLTVRTLGGAVVDAEVVHVNPNQTRVYFDAPMAGFVELM